MRTGRRLSKTRVKTRVKTRGRFCCLDTGCNNMSELQLLEITRRDECIKELRKHGLSIRQISRLTGISKGVIEKIGR